MSKQLYTDLARNADDRLENWTKDTVMRCEAVDMPEADAISMIVSTLLGRSIQMLKYLGMSRSDFLILMQSAYDQVPNEVRKKRGIF